MCQQGCANSHACERCGAMQHSRLASMCCAASRHGNQACIESRSTCCTHCLPSAALSASAHAASQHGGAYDHDRLKRGQDEAHLLRRRWERCCCGGWLAWWYQQGAAASGGWGGPLGTLRWAARRSSPLSILRWAARRSSVRWRCGDWQWCARQCCCCGRRAGAAWPHGCSVGGPWKGPRCHGRQQGCIPAAPAALLLLLCAPCCRIRDVEREARRCGRGGVVLPNSCA